MFELFADAELIDAMGECTRDESAMIAQRLAAVGELDARRARELAECRFWRTDPFEEVAAEISAAQNISRGRARGQIHMARVLRDELPAVATVFATGEIDYRLVDILISRTENVAAERKGDLDAAIARHCRKWMRLSKPKLRDRIDLWVTKFDPDAVRVPPKVKDNRYVETGETSPGMAGIWANLDAADAAVFDARLDALAATVCDKDPRTTQQRRADAVATVGPLRGHSGVPVRLAGLPGRRRARRGERGGDSCVGRAGHPRRAVIIRGICPATGSCPPSRYATWPHRARSASR